MKQVNRFTRTSCLVLTLAMALSGCAAPPPAPETIPVLEPQTPKVSFDYEVTPEDFTLTMRTDGVALPVAGISQTRTVADYKESGDETSWRYPNEQIAVSIQPAEHYLGVAITSESDGDNGFTWPEISASDYFIPLGEGKRVPSDNGVWQSYLNGQEISVMEQLSMPFWASSIGDYAVLYIMEDPYRTKLNFVSDPDIAFSVSHEYPEIDDNKTKRFRIYVTDNNPVSVAKLYRDYVMEQGRFTTLEQKAENAPDIRKLYGAPFLYLWGDFVISPDDIKWQSFRSALDTPVMNHLLSLADGLESGQTFQSVIADIKNQDYVDAYQKNAVCGYLSELLQSSDFWNPMVFAKADSTMEQLTAKGLESLSESQRLKLHKHALAANLPDVFTDASRWMDNGTTTLVSSLQKAGLDRAWIGLHGWEQGFAKPELVDTAVQQGYLIGSYDSYHSIHEPGKEEWSTARFTDPTLYESATVTGKDGEKEAGFQNVGRKLNPTLSLPSVKERMDNIVTGNQLPFNSWFIDCDATGEIYDDYTPGRLTTQQEDLTARLERMAYIRDVYHMVIGSEGGNDFAASTLAFAHGIELKSFSWMDEDMKKNKESEYYIGKYFSPSGGVAEHFSKRIPLKENYYTLFVDPRFDVPLFKLVYNDSVITSYHWDWSTFKIQGATRDRMLREVLYNVPPLYHLDATEWNRYGDDIANHNSVWSEFSRQAVTREMTDFRYLTDDGTVQMTQYGDDVRVIANFCDSPYQYERRNIPGKSILIEQSGKISVYTPETAPENQ